MTTVAFVLMVVCLGGPLCGHHHILPALAREVARAIRARRVPR